MAHKKRGHHGRHHLSHAEEVAGGKHSHRKHGRGHHGLMHAGHHSPGEVEEGEHQGDMAGIRPGKGYYGAGAGDFANMPREVKMEQYPKANYGVGVNYPDTYDAINEMQGGNERHMQSQRSKEMY